MAHKWVAVLDVRSSELTLLVGERGVNDTFVFKASRTEPYDGYDVNGNFFDENDKYAEAISRALSSVEQVCGERIKTLYVGVPGTFLHLVTKQHEISFPSARKITQREVDTLFQGAKVKCKGYTFIRGASMVYVTADNRRVVDPIGLSSEKLSGVLSYYYCADSFIEATESAFSGRDLHLKYIPSELAQVNYLIPSETRDESAIYLDVGELSSTVCIARGNGMVAQRSFWVGRAHMAAQLLESFSLGSYEAAQALLSKVSLYRNAPEGRMEFHFNNQTYDVRLDELNEVVRQGLSNICEEVDKFLSAYNSRELECKPLYVSGEGLRGIRGAFEFMSRLTSRVCEEIAPDLPYYNKPTMSARISLVDMALNDEKSRGFFYRLLNGLFG